ncbi:PREDICTED: uncharacterized protein LOC109484071 [Branchiostoma belcheri]|uniref:Uncharacterized protein LOC109484071 n=1 Tax=Branchiostoma belcheri TaxID=7741 RepID=A0A6P5A9E3_BRABE|nr:PREDICTED: uncharacterized protein LOC109484071 [Branchiostoma belcheri]XP_019642840.1 PREDICTED: uncharacterized protein LOC109484071 [Branchiostoma belcheri]XP_019642841.1 PREDICTED: uncharacterized protein LOC109484071 [Branchiostoma belcheri]
MAMEKQHVLRDTHNHSVTALGHHPTRREILAGFEDGVIKAWESDSGKLSQCVQEHAGWITDFLFWADEKLLLSASNDGTILCWSAGGTVLDRITFGYPIYKMTLNVRRHHLICGFNAAVKLFDLDENKESGHFIKMRGAHVAREHTDIVRCIVCHENRVYTAGYDRKFMIYDTITYPGTKGLNVLYSNHNAHDAGINCMIMVKDSENNTWILTGSFDKTVKIWSPDGQLTHKLDGFMSAITSICYCKPSKTVWVGSGTSYASLYDPKSGENVSDFIGTFQSEGEQTLKYHLQLLCFCPEFNQVVASSSRRQLFVWKYNTSGCITALKCKHAVESLTYTQKVPILIFSGGSDGMLNKFERLQTNTFMYSKESFLYSEAQAKLAAMLKIKNKRTESDSTGHSYQSATRQHAVNKPFLPPGKNRRHANVALLRTMFVESLDLLVATCEDSNIYVWGFDDEAATVLQRMQPSTSENLVQKYLILLGPQSQLLPRNGAGGQLDDHDSVTNRVAGFICKNVLQGHNSCVTSVIVVGKEAGYDRAYLVSGGWDRRLLIWDLAAGTLHDFFRSSTPELAPEAQELACDGIIIDMAYCPKRNEFAYASSDKMVYIRTFSPVGSEMTLVNTLQGHEAEITQVRWNHLTDKWVTASEDGTLRIWSEDGMNCDQILNVHGTVSALCIDQTNGCMVAGVQDVIKVYESEQYKLVQTNVGHTDAVRCIIHIPERAQYVSSSWDMTIQIWNAYKKPVPRKKVQLDENKPKTFIFPPGGTISDAVSE